MCNFDPADRECHRAKAVQGAIMRTIQGGFIQSLPPECQSEILRQIWKHCVERLTELHREHGQLDPNCELSKYAESK